jgi:ABC-type uncharacterized transport system ATPase component
MKTETISIKVDSEVARVYQKASGDQKKKMEILVNLWLKEFASDKKTLKQVMDEISEKAKAKDLTQEILDSALNGR